MSPDLCQIPGFCVDGAGTSIPGIEGKVNCDIIVGYKSVYRMCFAMACFFFLFSVIMIRVRSSKDPRASIQNGYVTLFLQGGNGALCWGDNVVHVYNLLINICILFVHISFTTCAKDPLNCFDRFWFFKFLILVGITVGAFFIPDGIFNTGTG